MQTNPAVEQNNSLVGASIHRFRSISFYSVRIVLACAAKMHRFIVAITSSNQSVHVVSILII